VKNICRAAVVGCAIAISCGSTAQGQFQNRQPTRRVEPQIETRVRPHNDDQPQLNRQQTRRVQGGPGAGEPQLDPQSGQFRVQRDVIRPGLRRLPVRPAARWRLGVNTDNAPKGMLITDVARNSPAQHFGLEPGDYILDVMGYPVGFYGNAYYPIAEAFNQLVRRDGWVNILIWNKRTNAEEAMWIQLERRSGGGVVVPFGRSGSPRSEEN
jgi:hypothetical protein